MKKDKNGIEIKCDNCLFGDKGRCLDCLECNVCESGGFSPNKNAYEDIIGKLTLENKSLLEKLSRFEDIVNDNRMIHHRNVALEITKDTDFDRYEVYDKDAQKAVELICEENDKLKKENQKLREDFENIYESSKRRIFTRDEVEAIKRAFVTLMNNSNSTSLDSDLECSMEKNIVNKCEQILIHI